TLENVSGRAGSLTLSRGLRPLSRAGGRGNIGVFQGGTGQRSQIKTSGSLVPEPRLPARRPSRSHEILPLTTLRRIRRGFDPRLRSLDANRGTSQALTGERPVRIPFLE